MHGPEPCKCNRSSYYRMHEHQVVHPWGDGGGEGGGGVG